MTLFRTLTDAEVAEFKAAARAVYQPYSPIMGIWHPVYQAECVAMNAEAEEAAAAAEPDDGIEVMVFDENGLYSFGKLGPEQVFATLSSLFGDD